MRAAVLVLPAVLAACGADRPLADTNRVDLGRAGPSGVYEVTGERRGGLPCVTLRDRDQVLAERCGFTTTDLRTWEVSVVSDGDRVIVFAPLPASALRVRIDGADRSLHVVDARSAEGFPARFLLDEVDSTATPQVVRVFADNGRALVPDP